VFSLSDLFNGVMSGVLVNLVLGKPFNPPLPPGGGIGGISYVIANTARI
jgi:hypothetical protein